MQAQEKGIDAIMINEDTTHMADIWKRARTTAAMAYLSPEMAIQVSDPLLKFALKDVDVVEDRAEETTTCDQLNSI